MKGVFMTEGELFKDYFTEEEVAKLLDLSVGTLRNWHTQGKAPPRGPGRRYSKVEFAKWFNKNTEHPIARKTS
jgi:hypothetical protein